VFLNIPFIEEDHILIKNLYLLKSFPPWKLLKSWNDQSLEAAK